MSPKYAAAIGKIVVHFFKEDQYRIMEKVETKLMHFNDQAMYVRSNALCGVGWIVAFEFTTTTAE